MTVSARTERTVTLPDGTVKTLRAGNGTVPCGVCSSPCWDHLYRPAIGWRCAFCVEKHGTEEIPDLCPEEFREILDDFLVMVYRNIVSWAGAISEFEIVEDKPGYGRHTCNGECNSSCYRSCDDSDRIVTIRYDGYHVADYAELDGKIVLWAN